MHEGWLCGHRRRILWHHGHAFMHHPHFRHIVQYWGRVLQLSRKRGGFRGLDPRLRIRARVNRPAAIESLDRVYGCARIQQRGSGAAFRNVNVCSHLSSRRGAGVNSGKPPLSCTSGIVRGHRPPRRSGEAPSEHATPRQSSHVRGFGNSCVACVVSRLTERATAHTTLRRGALRRTQGGCRGKLGGFGGSAGSGRR